MSFSTYMPQSAAYPQQPMMQTCMGQPQIMQQPPQMAMMKQQMQRPIFKLPTAAIPRVADASEVDNYALDGSGAEAIFLHNREDIFFYRSNDSMGRPLPTQAFRFEPLPDVEVAPVAYATKEETDALRRELDELKGVLNNGKQPRKAKADADE